MLAKLHNWKIDWLSMVVVLFRWLVALSVALALGCCLSVTGWILALRLSLSQGTVKGQSSPTACEADNLGAPVQQEVGKGNGDI